MRLDLSEVLTNFNGEALRFDTEGKRLTTLGIILVESLMANFPEEKISGEDKIKRYKLASRLHGAESAEVSAEEVALCKELVSKAFGTLVVGQVWMLLEGEKVQR